MDNALGMPYERFANMQLQMKRGPLDCPMNLHIHKDYSSWYLEVYFLAKKVWEGEASMRENLQIF
jgi:hypothetical protein